MIVDIQALLNLRTMVKLIGLVSWLIIFLCVNYVYLIQAIFKIYYSCLSYSKLTTFYSE